MIPKVKFGLVVVLTILLFSCADTKEEFESDFGREFYLTNQNCFGRYFYENPITGEVEYELYCEGQATYSMTEKADSIMLKDDLGKRVLAKASFFEEFGNPTAVEKLDHSRLRFKVDTLEKSVDSLDMEHHAYQTIQRFELKICYDNDSNLLYDRIFKSNRIVLFDSSNINVYHPTENPNLHFIDGVNPCLVLEMGYYDEMGDFAGWERFSADIKAFVVKD